MRASIESAAGAAEAAAIHSIRQYGQWGFLPLDLRAFKKLTGEALVVFDGPPMVLHQLSKARRLAAEKPFQDALRTSILRASPFKRDSDEFEALKKVFKSNGVRYELAAMLDSTLVVLMTRTPTQALHADNLDSLDAKITLRCDGLLSLIRYYHRQDPTDLHDWLSKLLFPAVRAAFAQFTLASTAYAQADIDSITLPSVKLIDYTLTPAQQSKLGEDLPLCTYAPLFRVTHAPSAPRTKPLIFSGLRKLLMPVMTKSGAKRDTRSSGPVSQATRTATDSQRPLKKSRTRK